MKKLLVFLSAMLSTAAVADNKLGVSVGTPALLNLVYKGDIANLPLQISGGLWPGGLRGIELGYRFRERDTTFSGAQFLLGYSHFENSSRTREWTYVGVSATFSFGGFYVEPGLTVGTGSFSNPQASLQLGYLWSL